MKISAEVIFKTRDGRSLLSEGAAIDAAHIKQLMPGEEGIKRTISRFRALGFTVCEPGVTLTLIGERDRFEKVFRIRLRPREQGNRGSGFCAEGEPVIPSGLADVVQTIVFPEPPEFN